MSFFVSDSQDKLERFVLLLMQMEPAPLHQVLRSCLWNAFHLQARWNGKKELLEYNEAGAITCSISYTPPIWLWAYSCLICLAFMFPTQK